MLLLDLPDRSGLVTKLFDTLFVCIREPSFDLVESDALSVMAGLMEEPGESRTRRLRGGLQGGPDVSVSRCSSPSR